MNNLDRLIAAIQCPEWKQSVCKACPYDYQIELTDEENRPRHSYYDCNRVKMLDDALFYLEELKRRI